MLNGVVVVEVVFGWPGVGSLVVRALETRDYPLIQATVLVTAVLAVVVQLLVDLLYPLLDPAGPSRKGRPHEHPHTATAPRTRVPAPPSAGPASAPSAVTPAT